MPRPKTESPRVAVKLELDPTNRQRTLFARYAGTRRWIFNTCLEYRELYWSESQLNVSHEDLRQIVLQHKYSDCPWLLNFNAQMQQEAIADFWAAIERFWAKQAGFPHYKKRGVNDRFRFTQGVRVSADGRNVRLPGGLRVRLKESPWRRATSGTRVTRATISRVADRWFVSFVFAAEPERTSPKTQSAVGIDSGISSLLTISDGRHVEAPKPLVANLRKLRSASRALSRTQKGSKRRAKARLKLARLHARIANVRHDFANKVTSGLVRKHSIIVVEALSVKGMARNRRLARSVSDVAMSELLRQIKYKAMRGGVLLVEADMFFPSTQTCSGCGARKVGEEKLGLSERTFHCAECGLKVDRDLNAARNLRKLGLAAARKQPVAATTSETLNARRESGRPGTAWLDSLKREPSTAVLVS